MDQGVNIKKSAFATFLIIATAWMFDALDVGLLSFIMPIVRQFANRFDQFSQHDWDDLRRLLFWTPG